MDLRRPHGGLALVLQFSDGSDSLPIQINSANGYFEVVESYRSAVSHLRAALAERAGQYVVCVSPRGMRNILEGNNETVVIPMLRLTFPELRWIEVPEDDDEPGSADDTTPSMPSLDDVRFDDLFDGSGSRLPLYLNPKDGGQSQIQLAVAIDEEQDYAYYHAFIAYRFGRRAIPITSYRELQAIAGVPQRAVEINRVGITFEDIFLKFPDQPGDVSELWSIKERDQKFPALQLEPGGLRCFITSGDHPGQTGKRGRNWYEVNQPYFERLKEGHIVVLGQLKPTPGMFSFWETISESADRAPGNSRGTDQAKASDERSHSAPGRVLLVARTLLDRGRAGLAHGNDIKSFLISATFATIAWELLGHRTPTTAVQALSLKHEAEVKAECGFLGVRLGEDVEKRAEEIATYVGKLKMSFSGTNFPVFEAQSIVTILSRLAQIYRGVGHFEAELACLTHIRRWNRRLEEQRMDSGVRSGLSHISGQRKRDAFFGPVKARLRHAAASPVRGLLAYVEWLLARFRTFVLVTLGWIVVSALIWCLFDCGLSCFSWTSPGWQRAVSGVVTAFFSGTAAPIGSPWPLTIFSVVVVTAGFIHLGVLIAFLYTLVSRR